MNSQAIFLSIFGMGSKSHNAI